MPTMTEYKDCDEASSMEVPRSIEGVVMSNSGSSTTKPRKKRKKKKKKKKKKRASSEPVSSDDESVDFGLHIKKEADVVKNNTTQQNNAPSGASNISTPQEVLRRRLIENDGYDAAQVERAMEEMWDKGMAFDEYESIVCYMTKCDSQTIAATASTVSASLYSVSTKSEEEVDLDTGISTHSENECLSLEEPEEKEEEITAIAASNGDSSTSHDDGEKSDCKEEEEEEENYKEEEHNEEANEGQSVGKSAPACSFAKMARKLDMVASFECLTDAIFALTQWVKKAASNEEIEFFCKVEASSALPTIIRRGISSEIDEASRFEIAVQPALVRLLMAVLDRCGIGELGANVQDELEEKMEQMLKQARKVSLSDEDNESMIGDRVSRFIVSRLAIAMDEKNKYNKIQMECSNALYQDDLTMAAMLSLSECLKAHAIHASKTLQHSMEFVFGHSAMTVAASNLSPLQSTSSFEINDITLHIVDQETKNRFDEERSRLEELKLQVPEEGETSETVRNLHESLISLESKRKEYREKITKLRAVLEEIEAQEKDVSVQIESISKHLVEEEQIDDAKTKCLEENIAQSNKSMRYRNLVSGLAGMMKTYSKSIENATASKTGKRNPSNDSDELASGKMATDITEASTLRAMEDYLTKIRKYLVKEAYCFTRLNHRLATKTAEVTSLQSELAQYNNVKGLFATSTIPTQINQAIGRNERLIQAYNQKLLAQADEGRVIYEDLLARLETYNTNTATADGSTRLFLSELLQGVPEAIRTLKIDCVKLMPFMKEPEEEAEETNSNSITIENTSDPAAPQSESHQPPPLSVAAPTFFPKLVWASASAKQVSVASKEPKVSLLDIQKEELIRSRESAGSNNNGQSSVERNSVSSKASKESIQKEMKETSKEPLKKEEETSKEPTQKEEEEKVTSKEATRKHEEVVAFDEPIQKEEELASKEAIRKEEEEVAYEESIQKEEEEEELSNNNRQGSPEKDSVTMKEPIEKKE